MASRLSIEAIFKAKDRMTAPITKMQNRVGKFTRSISKGIKRANAGVDKLTGKFRQMPLVGAASVAGLGFAMKNVIETGAEFDRTLTAATAKFPGNIERTSDAFKALKAQALETGSATEFTATQAAQGLNFLALAGFDAQQSIAALPKVVDLATASQLELGEASDIATDTLGAFNLMTKDTTKLSANLSRVMDVMAKTTTRSNTDMVQMFEAIKEGGPVLSGMGGNIETFGAMVGKLADAGIKGTKAGTTLKNVFLRLAAPTGEAAGLVEKFIGKTTDAAGNLKDPIKLLGILEKNLAGNANRAAILNKIFGKIPMAGVNVLLATGAKKTAALRDELFNADKASMKMAKTMRDTVQGRIAALNSAIEGIKLAFFDAMAKPLTVVIKRLTDYSRRIKDVINANQQLIQTRVEQFFTGVLKFLKFVAKNHKVIIAMAKGLAIAVVSLKALNAVLAVTNVLMRANPMVLVATGVVALVAGIIFLTKNWDAIRARFAAAPMEMQPLLDTFKKFGDFISRVVNFAARKLPELWERFQPVILKLIGAFNALPGPIKRAVALIVGGPVAGLILAAEQIINHWDKIAPAVKVVARIIIGAMEGVLKVITKVLEGIDLVSRIGGAAFRGITGRREPQGQKIKDHGRTVTAPEIMAPSERVERAITESRETSTARIEVAPEAGATATMPKKPKGRVEVVLEPSGNF